jgi:hypothetical protein
LWGVNEKDHDFFKIFSNNPKVLPDAAVNDYMNGVKPTEKECGLFKYFSKKP